MSASPSCECFSLCGRRNVAAFHLRLPIVTHSPSPWHAYLRRVYGVPMNQSVNVEQLNFFYNYVPRRDTFAATWQCAVGWESNNSDDGGYRL